MYQIQRLNIYNPKRDGATDQAAMTNSTPGPYSHLACQTLDLLLSRLLAQSPIALTWLEKTVVTRVWISSLSLNVQDHPRRLGNLFDDIVHANGTKLSVEATHASQSVSTLEHPNRKFHPDSELAYVESCHCSAANTE